MKEVIKALNQYLIRNRWNSYDIHGNTRFAKSEVAANIEETLSPTWRERKRKISINEVAKEIERSFLEKSYTSLEAMHIVQKNETIFTSAGIQAINLNEEIAGQAYIAQPVVRTHCLGLAEREEGCSTAFTNICTINSHSSVEDYLTQLDHWMSVLSSLGIYMGNCVLSQKITNNNWGHGDFRELVLRIHYMGLEIGDACYIDKFPNKTRVETAVTDIGFGVERIVWALNKSPSYYDSIYPAHKILRYNRGTLDRIRTATLLVASGVKPSNKDEGWQLRKILKEDENIARSNLFDLVSYFYDSWQNFSLPERSKEETYNEIQKEAYRNTNLQIAKSVGIRPKEDSVVSAPSSVFINKIAAKYHLKFERINFEEEEK